METIVQQPTEQTETTGLRPFEKQRLARLALRIIGAEAAPAGFLRGYLWNLDRQIKAGIVAEKADTAQRAKQAASDYLAGKGSLSQMCKAYQLSERTLSRSVARLRKAQTAQPA